MVRFLVRALGLLLVAAGFVGLVVDGTRAVANGSLIFTPLGQVAYTLFPTKFPLIEPAVSRHVSPFLWDPVLLNVFLLPAGLVGVVLGAVLLWLGRRPPETIGHVAGP